MIKPKFTPQIIMPDSVLCDPKKEDLDIILNPFLGLKDKPTDIQNSVGEMTFKLLIDCFKKAGFVAEGMLGNVIWGFEQCGYDPRAIAAGLTELRLRGYLSYSDQNRMPISEQNFDPAKPIWIRYTDKFRNLLAGGVVKSTGGIILS